LEQERAESCNGGGDTDLVVTPMSLFKKSVQNGQYSADSFRLKKISCI
jgi:hypothetical protein